MSYYDSPHIGICDHPAYDIMGCSASSSLINLKGKAISGCKPCEVVIDALHQSRPSILGSTVIWWTEFRTAKKPLLVHVDASEDEVKLELEFFVHEGIGNCCLTYNKTDNIRSNLGFRCLGQCSTEFWIRGMFKDYSEMAGRMLK